MEGDDAFNGVDDVVDDNDDDDVDAAQTNNERICNSFCATLMVLL